MKKVWGVSVFSAWFLTGALVAFCPLPTLIFSAKPIILCAVS